MLKVWGRSVLEGGLWVLLTIGGSLIEFLLGYAMTGKGTFSSWFLLLFALLWSLSVEAMMSNLIIGRIEKGIILGFSTLLGFASLSYHVSIQVETAHQLPYRVLFSIVVILYTFISKVYLLWKEKLEELKRQLEEEPS